MIKLLTQRGEKRSEMRTEAVARTYGRRCSYSIVASFLESKPRLPLSHLAHCPGQARARDPRRQSPQLVRHQTEERADNQRQPLEQHRREGVAEALSAAGGGDEEGALPAQDAVDGPGLAGAEGRVPEVGEEDVLRRGDERSDSQGGDVYDVRTVLATKKQHRLAFARR